jgi:hypothetical protein
MNAFKRLCLFVFGLAGLACLALFVLPLCGVGNVQVAHILSDPIGYRVVLGCAAFVALGLLICVLYALFAPRNARTIQVSTMGGDKIQVSRDAIRAQAVHVIESDGRFSARSINVRAKKRGHVRVSARVQPARVVNVVESGAELHDRLVEGLSEVCGSTLDRVELEFVDAASHEEEVDFDTLEARYSAQDATLPQTAQPQAASASAQAQATAPSEGITVSMSHVASSPSAYASTSAPASAAYVPSSSASLDAQPDDTHTDAPEASDAHEEA